MSYETAADLEHSQQDQDNTYSKQRSSRNDHAWIEDLDDDEITAMWSEVLSIRNVMPKEILTMSTISRSRRMDF